MKPVALVMSEKPEQEEESELSDIQLRAIKAFEKAGSAAEKGLALKLFFKSCMEGDD